MFVVVIMFVDRGGYDALDVAFREVCVGVSIIFCDGVDCVEIGYSGGKL